MPTSKICTTCNKDKPLKEFSKSKLGKYGFHSKCKSCMNLYQKSRKENGDTPSKKILATSAPMELSFLKEIERPPKVGMRLGEAKTFLAGIQRDWQKYGSDMDFKAAFQKYGSGKALSSCTALWVELKRVAEKGEYKTIDEYWRAGRPYKYGNKVVKTGKK